MNKKLIEINDLVLSIVKIKKQLNEINLDEYKCEYWDKYEEECNKLLKEFNDIKKLLVERCNDYIQYPKKTILFFEITKGVSIVKDEVFSEKLIVPFIDKREYYCVINLFKNHENLLELFEPNAYIFSYNK